MHILRMMRLTVPANEGVLRMARLYLCPAILGLAILAWPLGLAAYDEDDFDPLTAPALKLYYSGDFLGAQSALSALAAQGDAEAALFGLSIRRNGLDGAPAEANPKLYIDALRLRAPLLDMALEEGGLPTHKRDSYRCALAYINYFGLGGGADKGRGRRLAETAAASGLRPALNLMTYIADSEGLEARAVAYAESSEKKGDPLGSLNLSAFYLNGVGVTKDELRAAYLARRACDNKPGFPRARNLVGVLYETGRGVSQDADEALRWYKMAADQNYAPAKFNASKKPPARPQMESGVAF